MPDSSGPGERAAEYRAGEIRPEASSQIIAMFRLVDVIPLCMTRNTMTHTSVETSSVAQVLAGQHALVTGGSEGIGYGIAEHLLDAGATVTLAARRPAVLD
ncbi:SDR family NAD(P)-dependent oxidoreductase, partial [Rhodococcus zopfii]|uniref:SDR family NAD(P)-dependent oxidoreductase n=1 Tax=Rhodococcus zopfii TaxID=43772 RepID=UPI0027E0F4CC